jgi:DNA repair exonuclease SbcCD ATPase subunit
MTNSVTFKAASLPKDKEEFYQFLYLDANGKLCGTSDMFQFTDESFTDYVEVDETPSLIQARQSHSDDYTFPDIDKKSISSDSKDSELHCRSADELESLKQRLYGAEIEISTLKENNQELEQQLHKVSEAERNECGALDELQEKLTETLKLNAMLKGELQSTESEFRKSQDDWSRKDDHLKQELVKKKEELDGMKHELNRKILEIDELALAHAKYREEAQRKSTEAHVTIEQLKVNIDDYILAKLEWDAKEDNYKKELDDCKRQLDDCKRQLDDCERQLLAPTPSPPEPVQTCPYCPLQFPDCDYSMILDHIATHGDKVCPVCSTPFQQEHPQIDFEVHVNMCMEQHAPHPVSMGGNEA